MALLRCISRSSDFLRSAGLFYRLQSAPFGLTSDEFRKRGKDMVDFIVNYRQTVTTRKVRPNVKPGFLINALPKEAPQKPDSWDDIMCDLEEKIIPGMVHWQHPKFHAYFPLGHSYPSLLGDMLSGISAAVGFSWASCPVQTELEIILLDWMAKALGLPDHFRHECGRGGGVMQGSASACILAAMFAARCEAVRKLREEDPDNDPDNPKHASCYIHKLVAYTSAEAHSCVEKAAHISFVKIRLVEPDEKNSMRGDALEKLIKEDLAKGLLPFFVNATIGTTSCCSFDNLPEIGEVCCKYPSIWLHTDAAYAGTALICPEYRHLLEGIEHVESFNTNANKWLLIHTDCSLLFMKDSDKLVNCLLVDPVYLHKEEGDAVDFRHWGITLSRRFRAAKLWFVLRTYGLEGLQNNIRHQTKLAKYLESLIQQDDRFEIANEVTMGLVCFRLCGPEELTKQLLLTVNDEKDIFLTLASVQKKYIIRFCINYYEATEKQIKYSWTVIQRHAAEILKKQGKC
ncbi:aromatic-L-amino-acid decarboxylase-like [Periplaneta americana]|uniref:aromatic-L-amino-acid decarboxylase-like n=1 Tax=Periplaneta americana TaxID=6978 RepID=UPI0037E7945F